jgi:hypothetical protein
MTVKAMFKKSAFLLAFRAEATCGRDRIPRLISPLRNPGDAVRAPVVAA